MTSAAKAWGIGAKTGLALQTIAALGHYGLFEFHGSGDTRTVRLTEGALNILLDKQPVSPERDTLIRQAALRPPIHNELWQKWQDSLPSDATLETFLIRDKHFSENGARDLIEEYKSTIRFAKPNQSANIPLDGDVAEEVADDGGESQGGAVKPPLPPPPLQVKGQVRLMDGERVAFTEEGQPGQYLKLIASGEVDDGLLEALEDFVKRQRKRLQQAASAPRINVSFVKAKDGKPDPEN
jgi:hypothetical protein